jgi:hypothetical protein
MMEMDLFLLCLVKMVGFTDYTYTCTMVNCTWKDSRPCEITFPNYRISIAGGTVLQSLHMTNEVFTFDTSIL